MSIVTDSYINSIVELKCLKGDQIDLLKCNLGNAFRRIYRAVALDVDGTLTDGSETKLNSEIIPVIASLLKKGIPVILISGRGCSSMRSAAAEIREAKVVSDWYLRRLQCVCYNGLIRLFTKTSKPDKFLELEDKLNVIGVEESLLLSAFLRKNGKYVYKSNLNIGYIRVDVDQDGKHLIDEINSLAVRLNSLKESARWVVSNSLYGGVSYMTLTSADKSYALERIADRLGIPSNTILRIGDSGEELGNDAAILNCDSGFTVGSINGSPSGCFPIFDDSDKQLMQSRGTLKIIHSVKIFPPLSLHATSAESLSKRVADLTGFEKLVNARSKIESRSIDNQIDAKHRSQLSTGQRLRADELLSANDIFDLRSGAIKLKFWELEDLYDHSAYFVDALGLPGKLSKLDNFKGREAFAMFSDTCLMLRGPIYYWSITSDVLEKNSQQSESYGMCRKAPSIDRFSSVHLSYLKRLKIVIEEEWIREYGVVQLKVLLSALDQIRNLLLIVQYTVLATLEKKIDFADLSSQVIFDLLVKCAKVVSEALFNLDVTWNQSRVGFIDILDEVIGLIESDSFKKFIEVCNGEDVEVFKYRECDHFLQNLSALQIAFRDFVRHGVIDEKREITVYGLAYGGMELSAICKFVAQKLNLNVNPKIAKISLYSNKEIERSLIATAGPEYLELLEKGHQEIEFGGESVPGDCIILDDNCTTCSTLQLARDSLVSKGYYVRGCVAVRYPSTNRLVHMGLAGHGFPDPENLLSFVRGLVAPSPYSRLLRKRGESIYVDETGIFDKSKSRIGRYIKKHLGLTTSYQNE